MSYAPVTITFPEGSTITLSRVGDVVTMQANAVDPTRIQAPKPVPAEFTPRGHMAYYMANSATQTDPGSWLVLLSEIPQALGLLGIQPVAMTIGTTYAPFTAQWLADPEVPPTPPAPPILTPRVWLYQKLSSTPEIANLVGGLTDTRVFAKKSMTSAIEQHPYIVYKLGYNATEDISEETSPDRQFVQIFVHDYSDGDTGDYSKIDQIIDAMKRVLHLQSSKEYGVIACRYLETSQDLNDETLNTVFKYVRFQLITNGV